MGGGGGGEERGGGLLILCRAFVTHASWQQWTCIRAKGDEEEMLQKVACYQ
jgi:hypothetical protein